jgi:hypothetical protein
LILKQFLSINDPYAIMIGGRRRASRPHRNAFLKGRSKISFSSPDTARSAIVRMIQQRRMIINVEESSNVMIFIPGVWFI